MTMNSQSSHIGTLHTSTRVEELQLAEEFDITRQRDWYVPAPHHHCTMVGCGGIGSFTAFALSKLGITNLTIIDFDEVEAHNIPNQCFQIGDAGMLKTDAVKEICTAFGGSEIEAINERVSKEYLRDVVITGLDSMGARKDVWEMVKFNIQVEVLIDARLAGQTIAIYSINPCDPDDIKYYEENLLYSDEEAEDDPCTARGIIDVGMVVAGLITNTVRKHYTGVASPRTLAYDAESLTIHKFD